VFHAKNGWERNEVKDSFLKLKFGPSAWPDRTAFCGAPLSGI
jgi:hypothetical protein